MLKTKLKKQKITLILSISHKFELSISFEELELALGLIVPRLKKVKNCKIYFIFFLLFSLAYFAQ